jgi:dTDP-glucose 4,6-dehydratase
LEMAELIAAALDVELDWRFEDYHSSRPGHDHRYSLNDGKIREAGWSPPLALNQSLERTVSWTLKHQDWLNV